MGVLPGGTGNGFANEMQTPDTLKSALELLCTGHKVRHVDVVHMGDSYFIKRLYVGIEPEQQTSRESKDKYGTFAYAIDSYHRARDIKEINYQVTIDGESFEFQAVKIYVVNSAKAGTGISITDNISKIDDGLVDIFILDSKNLMFTAMIAPVILAYAESGLVTAVIVVIGVILINTGIESIIEPRFTGKTLKLSPAVVMVSFFVWGWLLGPTGALLSMPITVTLMLVTAEDEHTKWISKLIGTEEGT